MISPKYVFVCECVQNITLKWQQNYNWSSSIYIVSTAKLLKLFSLLADNAIHIRISVYISIYYMINKQHKMLNYK